MARLVLLCGLPGSGKTTLARRLAEELPAVRLCADEWMTDLGLDLYDEPMRQRLDDRFWLLAQDLLRLGQDVVLEAGFWSRAERDAIRSRARSIGAAVELRFLDHDVEELWRRLEQRNAEGPWGSAAITRAELERWLPLFEAPDHEELASYDPPR